jgi:transposase
MKIMNRKMGRITLQKIKKIFKENNLEFEGRIIAIDSTGFLIQGAYHYRKDKHGEDKKRREFAKAHTVIDVSTRQVIGLVITKGRSHDSKQFKELIEIAQQHCGKLDIVYADTAYSSGENFFFVCVK